MAEIKENELEEFNADWGNLFGFIIKEASLIEKQGALSKHRLEGFGEVEDPCRFDYDMVFYLVNKYLRGDEWCSYESIKWVTFIHTGKVWGGVDMIGERRREIPGRGSTFEILMY